MTFAQLQTFLTVAEAGSVHAAAERLVVTQSAVSTSLATLQRSLGLKLICRAGRGIRLTQAGVVYAEYVRRVFGLLDEARTAAGGGTDASRGELRLASVTTAGEQILPNLLARFRQRYPHVGIHLDVSNQKRVHALLNNHEADLIITGTVGDGPLTTTTHAVRPYELIVVAPSAERTRLTGSWDATRNWLGDQTWLLREHGSGIRSISHTLRENLEIDPPKLVMGSNSALREAVIAGLGVSVLSRETVARELDDGTVVEIPTPMTPVRRLWRLTSRDNRLSRTAELFAHHLLADGGFTMPRVLRPASRRLPAPKEPLAASA